MSGRERILLELVDLDEVEIVSQGVSLRIHTTTLWLTSVMEKVLL